MRCANCAFCAASSLFDWACADDAVSIAVTTHKKAKDFTGKYLNMWVSGSGHQIDLTPIQEE